MLVHMYERGITRKLAEGQVSSMEEVEKPRVVAIGASKGGLDAFQRLIKNSPVDTGQYTQHLKLVETSVSESIDAGESVEYIKEKLVDFENGFSKAPAFQKKRLIRKTVKQIAVTRENLAVWFYLNEDDEQTPGCKLQLVRDEG